DERRALVRAGALSPHRAAVRFHETLDDRKAEAEAAVAPRGELIHLPERIEDDREELVRNTLPGVGHRQGHPASGSPQADADAAALWRELDRVREQVREHLLQ